MVGGGAVRAERRRESETVRTEWRREWRARWSCPQVEGRVVASAGRACCPRGTAGLTRSSARRAAVSEREVEGDAGAGRPGQLRWLGRLVGAGPPVNSPLSLFL